MSISTEKPFEFARTLIHHIWRFSLYVLRGILFVVGLSFFGVKSEYLAGIMFWYLVWPGVWQALTRAFWFTLRRPRHGVQ